MLIDAHQHFWKYTPQEYGWIDDSMAVLRRDFLPADLTTVLAAAGVHGAVTVQARQSLEETGWLLDMAAQYDFLMGVVGWVPLVDARVAGILEEFAVRKKFKGVRHIVQAEPDDRYLLRADFNAGMRALARFDLTYDILIYERHLPVTIEFVDRHPNQRFVVDHLAKARVRDGALSPWRENIRELARREHVYCKLSGVATEADFHTWTEVQLRPYIETALEAFGPRRIMFGSDWPVCLAAIPYGDWFTMVSRLSTTEREWICGRTAQEFYRL